MESILIDVVVPIITAILGFWGGCSFEKYKNNQKISGDNNGKIAGRDMNNVSNQK